MQRGFSSASTSTPELGVPPSSPGKGICLETEPRSPGSLTELRPQGSVLPPALGFPPKHFASNSSGSVEPIPNTQIPFFSPINYRYGPTELGARTELTHSWHGQPPPGLFFTMLSLKLLPQLGYQMLTVRLPWLRAKTNTYPRY